MSAHVPVATKGGEILVPRSLFDELVEEGVRQEMARADQWAGIGYNNATFWGVGSQPPEWDLLRSLRGWAAIPATAVARRLRSLTVQVGEHIEQEDGRTQFVVIADHPLAEVMHRPNPVFSGRDLIWLAALHIQTVGEAYWQKIRDPLGVTRELWPLPPQNVDMVLRSDGVPSFRVQGTGPTVTLDAEDVVRMWDPDPETLLTSMGRLGPQWTEFMTSRYVAQHQESHYQNDAIPKVVVESGPEAELPSPKERKAFMAAMRNEHHQRHGHKRGEFAWLPEGLSAKELRGDGGIGTSVTISDSTREQLMAAFGVPESSVGRVKDVNRANAETNDYVMDKGAVKPIADQIEYAANTQLTPEYTTRRGEPVHMRFEPFVMPDKDFELRRDQQDLQTGTRTVNQVRADRGLPPVEYGDLPIMPFSVAPYTGEDPFDDPNALRDGERERERIDVRGDTHVRVNQTSEAAIKRHARGYGRRYVPRMTRDVLAIFRRQEAMLVALLETSALPRMPRLPKHIRQEIRASKYDPIVIERHGDVLDQLARALPPGTEAALTVSFEQGSEVYDVIEDGWRESATVAFNGVSDASMEIAWPSFETVAAQQVGRQTVKLASDVNRSTLRQVAAAISEGIAQGESISDLTSSIQSAGIFSRRRARTIARTEMGAAFTQAQREGWRATGEVEGKKWLTAFDNSREQHKAMHDVTVSIDESFVMPNGERTQVPRAASLSPENRVNCQCVQLAVIIGGET